MITTSRTFLLQYVIRIAHHIVKKLKKLYCDVVKILSTYCVNIIHHSVNFHNTVIIYVNHILFLFDRNFNIFTICNNNTCFTYMITILSKWRNSGLYCIYCQSMLAKLSHGVFCAIVTCYTHR